MCRSASSAARPSAATIGAPSGALEPHDRGVDAGEAAGGVERAREHLVEVDRAGDLAEEPAALALLLRPGDRSRELLRELVHPLLERLHHRPDPLVGAPVGAADHAREHDEEDQEAGSECRGYADEQVIHCRGQRNSARAGRGLPQTVNGEPAAEVRQRRDISVRFRLTKRV